MNRLLISAAHKSSGKTTVTLGLCAALRARGTVVQPFKKGPDYIDPMWLTLAAGRSCHNLDFYLQGHDEILRGFARHAHGAGISLIEGNKGLYDGLDLDGSNSNAALARLLHAPVILVIDARGMTRGIAPLILGYQAFDPAIRIAGVILNQLGGSRHERKLRAVIEHYTDVPVLGAVHHDERLAIVERHLGLMPSNEASRANAKIDAIAGLIAGQVDLDRVLAIAAAAGELAGTGAAKEDALTPKDALTPFPLPKGEGAKEALTPSPLPRGEGGLVKIGIARDAAFAFYYPDDLEALRAHGAELVAFDTLRDAHLPPVDGLFIGGGFPEVHIEALAANAGLRGEIRTAIEAGMPVYAECGGLMYLSRSLRWGERHGEMVGAIPADTVMHDRPQGRGYVRLRETGAGPWPGNAPDEIRAHEFHYSSLENLDPGLSYAYEVLRGSGIDGRRDGIVYKNVLACYAHLRDLERHPWTARFVDFVRRCRSRGHPQRAAL
ncbi:MAG TPA: cobyrinate a,c-diamide synthase [Acidiferrobacterales bacterium]